MERQDMTWSVLPEHWYDAAYMGNGTLGLMVYKEPGKNFLRLETGSCDVRDHRKGFGTLIGSSRLLTGYFKLCPVGRITGGTMRLSLWNAETTVHLLTTEGEIRLRCFVHADKMVTVCRAETSSGESGFKWEWVPASADSPRIQFGNWIKRPAGYLANPAPKITHDADGGMSVQRLVAGGETVVAWKETHRSHQRTLWANITHTYPNADASQKSLKEIETAIANGYRRLRKSHQRWWHEFYPKSFVTLDDGVKENFYWIQLYKLASATRADRALIDCTGPWLTVTPWPEAWWNLNVQLTYWPLNASNHVDDLAPSLENVLYNNVENLRLNIPEPYRDDALGIGRYTAADCLSDPIGVPGVSKDAEVGLLTWTCHNLWLIYRHRMDDTLLRQKLYPLLKGAVAYYLHFLREGADGKLHLPKTYSPEYGSAEDCNFDLALLRWGCTTLIQSADRLKINDPMLARWKEVVNRLTPSPTDSTGLMIGRGVPYSVSHRHYSHLLSIYPLYLLNIEQGADTVSLIEHSLKTWQGKTGAHQGYSLTGAASISAALGKGNDALRYLDGLFGRFLSSTTMYREAGPVIETPLSGVQSMFDMMLQSWGGKIRVFPAMPDKWQDVAFYKLRTEGAFEVSAKRKDGKTAFIHIKSLAGEPCIVVTDVPVPAFKCNGRKVEKMGKGTYRIHISRGEEALIYPQGEKFPMVISPVYNETSNCFGKK